MAYNNFTVGDTITVLNEGLTADAAGEVTKNGIANDETINKLYVLEFIGVVARGTEYLVSEKITDPTASYVEGGVVFNSTAFVIDDDDIGGFQINIPATDFKVKILKLILTYIPIGATTNINVDTELTNTVLAGTLVNKVAINRNLTITDDLGIDADSSVAGETFQATPTNIIVANTPTALNLADQDAVTFISNNIPVVYRFKMTNHAAGDQLQVEVEYECEAI